MSDKHRAGDMGGDNIMHGTLNAALLQKSGDLFADVGLPVA